MAAPGATADASPFRAGVVLGGRYRLISRVGTGSMGEVWRAEHLSLGTISAVKVLDASGGGDAHERLLRFQQEARAAARLRSPHIVHVLDHGVDGRFAFIAMELLHGESLWDRLVREKRLRLQDVVAVLDGMARGLSLAHSAGILHRDLKPANVFLCHGAGGPIVKILDFGIAKATIDEAELQVKTHEGRVLGTPSYMSPEQVRGYELDARSDLWAMGVIAFELVVGRRPFDGPTLGDTFMRICSGQVPPPSLIASDVPPGFDAWMAKALCFDREGRFSSATELVEALAELCAQPAGSGAHAAMSAPAPVPTGSQQVPRLSEPQPAPPPTAPTFLNAPQPPLTSSSSLPVGRAAWTAETGSAGRLGSRSRWIALGVAAALGAAVGAVVLFGPPGGHEVAPAASVGPSSAPALPSAPAASSAVEPQVAPGSSAPSSLTSPSASPSADASSRKPAAAGSGAPRAGAGSPRAPGLPRPAKTSDPLGI